MQSFSSVTGLLLGAATDSLASWHSRCAIHQDFPNFLESRLPCLELLGYLLQKAHRPSVIISAFPTGPAHRDLDGNIHDIRSHRQCFPHGGDLLVIAVQTWGLTLPQIAVEYDVLVAQVQEALAFSAAHREEIDVVRAAADALEAAAYATTI